MAVAPPVRDQTAPAGCRRSQLRPARQRQGTHSDGHSLRQKIQTGQRLPPRLDGLDNFYYFLSCASEIGLEQGERRLLDFLQPLGTTFWAVCIAGRSFMLELTQSMSCDAYQTITWENGEKQHTVRAGLPACPRTD